MAIAGANFIFLPVFVFVFIGNNFIRSIRWKILLSHLGRVPVLSLFPILLFGFFMNTVLPARGGEFVRAYLVQKNLQINSISTIGTIIAERLSDLLGLLLVSCFALKIMPLTELPFKNMIFFLGIAFGGIVFLLKYKSATSFFHSSKFFLFQWMGKSIEAAKQGFLALNSPKKIGGVVLLSFVIWINEALLILLMSQMLKYSFYWLHSFAVLFGISVGVMIPGAPGYIGTYEFFGKKMMEFLSYPSSVAINLVLVLHALQILLISVIGSLSFLFIKTPEKIPPL